MKKIVIPEIRMKFIHLFNTHANFLLTGKKLKTQIIC